MLRVRLPGLPRLPMAEPRTGLLPQAWVSWLQALAAQVDAAAFRVQTVSLIAQGAAITTTAVPMSLRSDGLYRISTRLRVTRPASSSSSLTLTIGWTDGGVACSQSGETLTGNTATTVQSLSMLVRSDSGTPITYAVAYGSIGSPMAQYALDLVVEAVPGVAT